MRNESNERKERKEKKQRKKRNEEVEVIEEGEWQVDGNQIMFEDAQEGKTSQCGESCEGGSYSILADSRLRKQKQVEDNRESRNKKKEGGSVIIRVQELRKLKKIEMRK